MCDQKPFFVPIDVADANGVKQAIESTVSGDWMPVCTMLAETSEEEYLRVINSKQLERCVLLHEVQTATVLAAGGGTMVNMALVSGIILLDGGYTTQ